MKKIKLLTPILGLTTLTGVVTPVITSCSNNGHVWLSNLDKAEKNANGNTAVYYFGLDKDSYKNDEFNIKVTGDNANDFNISWDISVNILKVTVTYTKEVSGDDVVTVGFKLNVKHINWNKEFDLKMNIEAEATFDQYLNRYEKIRNVWLAAENHPTTFDLAVGDYMTDMDNTLRVVTADSVQNSVYVSAKYDDPPYSRNVYDFDGYSFGYTQYRFREKEAHKQYIIENFLDVYQTVKFTTPSDGSLGFYYKGTVDVGGGYEETTESFIKLNKNGYIVEDYFVYNVYQSGVLQGSSICNAHISNHR